MGGHTVLALAPAFVAAGLAGLAGIQAFGNLAASAVAGVIWTAVSPRAVFVYLTAWMLIALIGLLANLPRGAFGPDRRGNPRM